MVAFALSKKDLRGRKLYTVMGIITMFFSGGMIPTYLLMKQLGLLNNFMVYILPQLFSYYDVVILMNFFRQIPASLEESAQIDGAGVWKIFLSIAMPLSKPALATIALFNGVYQWNDFMTAKLYMTNKDLFHNAVEGRMEELKQKPIVKEKETRGEKINKIFFFMLGFVIIISLIFTLIGMLR